MNDRGTNTYVIQTIRNEFYCGITKDILKRIIDHKNEKYPNWFSFKDRKNFCVLFLVKCNYEKEIKRFGVEKFMNIISLKNEVPLS
jgi:predicted GIY-YIG superfamily endonuclease